MKKIMVIGDLHGRNVWKIFGDIPILLKADKESAGYGTFEPDYDYYIFVGDYCDSFDKTNEQIKDNLLDIINFKKLYPDNVILLWGNHELHYVLDQPWLSNGTHCCSGYNSESHYELYQILNSNYELFQMSFQIKNYLFTHAGVHKGWYNDRFVKQFNELEKEMSKFELDYPNETLSDKLNFAFEHKMKEIFDVGHRRGGHCKVGGPLWLDKKLADKPLKGYHQVVGHSVSKDIYTLTPYKGDVDTSITFIDVLDKKKSFYTFNVI